MTALIELEGVSRSFQTPDGPITAVNDVSLAFEAGEAMCLVGESGCGKTTTGRMLAGLLRPTSGRLLYDGVPVHGYHTVKGTGAPQDRYGRNLYIDTLDSAYGPGWKRETSIVFRNPTGVFCYSFWPTNDASLPGHPSRPAGNGSAYRIEVIGPGVTPNLDVKVDDPGTWNPNDSAKKSFEDEMQTRQLQLSQGDAFCGGQT